MGADNQQFQSAITAIKFREEAKSAFDSLESVPNEYRLKFLQLLNSSPQGNVDEMLAQVMQSYEEWLNPYDNEEANKQLQIARKLGPAAEKQFIEALGVLGDSVDPEGVLNKVKGEHKEIDSDEPMSLDLLCMKYNTDSEGLMSVFGIEYRNGLYFYNDSSYTSFYQAALYADSQKGVSLSLDELVNFKQDSGEEPTEAGEVIQSKECSDTTEERRVSDPSASGVVSSASVIDSGPSKSTPIFSAYFIVPLTKKFANFEDRAPRAEYWYYSLFLTITLIALSFVGYALGIYDTQNQVGVLDGLFSLYAIIPGIAITVRRLHDVSRSGWWVLLWFIPILGWIVLFIWMVTASHPDNEYGQNPYKGEDR